MSEQSQPTTEIKSYFGPEGYQRAIEDMAKLQQKVANHLKPQVNADEIKKRYGKEIDQINIGGLSRELIENASDKQDAEMIQSVYLLSREILYGKESNAGNFMSTQEMQLLHAVFRETSGFLFGFALGKKLNPK